MIRKTRVGKKKSIQFTVQKRFSALYKRYIRIVPGIRSYVLAASLVFLLGMIITLVSWYVDRQRVDTLKNSQLSDQVASVESDIKNRLVIYEQILRGISGLYNASDSVVQDDVRQFVQQYNLQDTYPGIQSIGYVEHVPAASLQAYTDRMRASGYPDLSVKPAGDRAEYGPLTVLLSLTGTTSNSLVGFDILTDPTRAKLAAQARDTGKAGISDKTRLLSADGRPNGQPGFTMYIATYAPGTKNATPEERRQNLRGYVFAGYRSSNFFSQAINATSNTAYRDMQVFDGATTNKDALLYETTDFNKFDKTSITKDFTINLYNRPWTIRFANPVSAGTQDTQRSNMILIGGTTLSFAIAGFLFLVMLTRARAIVYSKQNEAQQAKDDLLSLASHQLRTPATAVKQYLGMILEGYTGRISKKQLPALQKAYTSNERQLEIINQILYVAKADAGRLSINREEFDLNILVDEIVLDLGDMLDQNEQTIEIDRPSNKMKIFGDEASIRMVVENLISNASKYSYQGAKITVKIGTKNNEVFVSIIDEGVGISADDHDKLFKKFSRIDNDLSLQVGGSGIGLYIDKVLVELHGGHIHVDSTVGQGSTFTVYLPKENANNLTDGDS